MIDTIRELQERIISFFRRRDLDDDFDAELNAHLELMTDENVRRGMSPHEARRAALVRLGGMERLASYTAIAVIYPAWRPSSAIFATQSAHCAATAPWRCL